MMYPYDPRRETVFDDTSRPAPRRRRRRKPRWPQIVALVLICAVVGCGAGFGGATLAVRRAADDTPAAVTTSAPLLVESTMPESGSTVAATAVTGKTVSPRQIYETYVGSTVGITTEITTTNVFGQTVRYPAAGSGFILTADGYILTNYHVIDKANTITVTLYNGDRYDAALIGGDANKDFAVIKIEASGLTPVVLGSSGDLHVGEQACLIGNPLGELTFSLTTGSISALNRSVTTQDGRIHTMIQTDCAINAGNSGGPLFNEYGQVVGIVSAKYASSGVEGLGFAIPMDSIVDMVADLVTYGTITGRPYLGASLATLSASQQQYYQLPAGAYVEVIAPGSCAEAAGLRPGDIITAVNGTSVNGSAQFVVAKDNYKAGDTVSLTVYRDGKTLTLSLCFDEQTAESEAALQAAVDEYLAQQTPQQSGGSTSYYDPFQDFQGFQDYFFSW